MSRFVVVISLWWVILSGCHAQSQTPSSMWVTGYYPAWAITTLPPDAVDYSALTHIIYFSSNPSRTFPYFDSTDAEHPWVPELITHARVHGVKMLLCVGGVWGQGAKDMEFVAGDSARVQIFVATACAYAQRKGYSGIDIDWEPPSNAPDFSRLMRMFRRILDSWTPRGTLAAAVGVTPYPNLFDIRAMNEYLDQINVMTYDLGQGQKTGHNAPLHSPSWTYSSWTIEDHGPAQWIKAGAHANKVSLGLPFYGRRDSQVDGPEQKKSSYWSPFMTYASILAMKNGSTYHWDEKAKVPWLGGTDSTGTKFFISYEEPWSIQEKVYYAASLGLGGLMVYELSQDVIASNPRETRNPLLNAMKETMAKLRIERKSP